MEIVPVLDLLGGNAVHAVAGERHAYQVVDSPLGHGSDPVALARALLAAAGGASLYVADLGAITGGAGHEGMIREFVACGKDLPPRPPLRSGEGVARVRGCDAVAGRGPRVSPGAFFLRPEAGLKTETHSAGSGFSPASGRKKNAPGETREPRHCLKTPEPGHPLSEAEGGPGGKVSALYWDAGLRTPADRARLPALPHLIPIWASETADPLALAADPPRGRCAFSVDLRGGVIVGDWRAWGVAHGRDAAGLAAAGVRLTGADAVIVLDLHAVGVRAGPPSLEEVRAVHAALPDSVRLGVGGGVRDAADLARLRAAGVGLRLEWRPRFTTGL